MNNYDSTLPAKQKESSTGFHSWKSTYVDLDCKAQTAGQIVFSFTCVCPQ